MKNKILFILMIASMSLSAQVSYDYVASTDTLTNADTVYVTMTKDYLWQGTVECGCSVTQLSGTSGGNARLQVNHSTVGTNWVNAGTDTLAVSSGAISAISTSLNGYRARLRIITTGTQSTKAVTTCTYKRTR